MLARLSPAKLFRGHRKGLADYRGLTPRPDRPTQAVVFGVPLLTGLAAWWWDWKFAAPAPVLTGIALLAGGFLTAFTHLSTLRIRLTEQENSWGDAERTDRDALDETAAHLLTASYMSGVTAFLLVIGMNVSVDTAGALVGWPAWLVAATASYIFMLFLIALPRLYAAYLIINQVRDALSGAFKGSSRS